jgi:hypothetical protein
VKKGDLKMKLGKKKWISIPLMAVALATVYPTQRAEAVVGLLTLNPIGALLGLGIGVAGSAVGTEGIARYGTFHPDGAAEIAVGMAAAFVGFVMLDGSNSQDIAFSKLTPAQAQPLGITSNELSAYNNELDTINLIRENVETQVPSTSPQDVQKAASLWQQYSSDLSPDAYSAAQKVAQAASKSLLQKQN